MIAIGSNELSNVSIKKGDVVIHKTTKEEAVVRLGKNAETNEESTILSFVTLKDGSSYLVGIEGRLFTDLWRLKDDC